VPSSVTLLRTAAVIALLQFLAHTSIFVFSTPKHGPVEAAVIEAMQSHSFNFSGSVRSYWDLYFGYGLLAAFNCLIEAVLFWQLATLAARSLRDIRPIIALFTAANLAYAAMVLKFFFIVPLVPDLVIAACLGGALFWRPRTEVALG